MKKTIRHLILLWIICFVFSTATEANAATYYYTGPQLKHLQYTYGVPPGSCNYSLLGDSIQVTLQTMMPLTDGGYWIDSNVYSSITLTDGVTTFTWTKDAPSPFTFAYIRLLNGVITQWAFIGNNGTVSMSTNWGEVDYSAYTVPDTGGGICFKQSDPAYLFLPGTPGTWTMSTRQADISIPTIQIDGKLKPKVRLAQVIFNPDINGDERLDFVAERETAVLVTVKALNYQGNALVRIGIGNTEVVAPEYVVFDTLQPQEKEITLYIPADKMKPGTYDLIVRVDPDPYVSESDTSNNEVRIPIEIKETRRLRILYVPIRDCGINTSCFTGGLYPGWETHVRQTINDSNKFILATFPIPSLEWGRWDGYSGSANKAKGQDYDLKTISSYATARRYDRAVAIVPLDYYTYHMKEKRIAGMFDWFYDNKIKKWRTLEGVSIWVTEPVAAAHELGHTYGIGSPSDSDLLNRDVYPVSTEEYKYANGDPKQPIRTGGFWVSEKKEITETNPDHFCFMYDENGATLNTRWVESRHYNDLFNVFLVDASTP